MSGKKFKQLLLQSTELDDIVIASSSSSSKKNDTGLSLRKTDKKKRKSHVLLGQASLSATSQEIDDYNTEDQKLKSQLESILFFDHAFSNRSEAFTKSKSRRMKEMNDEKRDRKKIRSNDGLNGTMSNSRSSSSYHARRNHEPTFNKKKDAERKRIQNLVDLAKQLKKRKK